MIESAFIDDGYEKDGYIARRPGLHPAVSFVFRPMIPTQKARMLADQNRSKNPEEGEVLAAKEIAKRLKLTRTAVYRQPSGSSGGTCGHGKARNWRFPPRISCDYSRRCFSECSCKSLVRKAQTPSPNWTTWTT